MRPPPGLVAVLLAFAVAAAGAGLRAAQEPGPGPGGPALRVATWNVHRFQAAEPDGRVTLEGVRDALAEQEAGIVGLQETEMARPVSGAFDAPGWLARQLDLHAVYGPPTRDQVYGVSLLSAYPVQDHRVLDLPVDGSVPRVAVQATLQAPSGPLPVYVAHLSVIERPEDRLEQAEALAEAVASHDRALLLGDMNSPAPDDPAYQVLDGSLEDAWTAADPPEPGPTTIGRDPGLRIDQVWLAGNWTVDTARTAGGPSLSDHRAVVADLTPADAAPGS